MAMMTRKDGGEEVGIVRNVVDSSLARLLVQLLKKLGMSSQKPVRYDHYGLWYSRTSSPIMQ